MRHLLEKIADPAELGKVPVSGTNDNLRLAAVATITVDHQPLIGDAVIAGGQGLLLVVEKFPGASTLEVTDGVEEALDDLQPGLSGIRTDASLFRPATYIDSATNNLELALGVGLLLMLLVMAALRFGWRAILIASITVPLSVVVAGLLLQVLGQGFNALVILGLAAAVTIVVDEAVVFTERVTRRLRQREQNGDAPSIATAVLQASQDIRGPLVYAALVVLLAVVPVAVLGRAAGRVLRAHGRRLRAGKEHSVTVLSPIPISVALGMAVALVVVAVRGGANVPQEATQHKQSRYHRQKGRGHEERKPERTTMVGMPGDNGEQHGGQKQDEVAPVLDEVTGDPLTVPTLLYGHDEVVDVLCDDLLKRGSTGDLIFRNPLQRVQFRFDDGSQVRTTRSPFARHPAE